MREAPDPTAARRAAILDAAAGVFMRFGYRKTSMDDLARAAGLSRQGLYLHFATKEELFKAGVLRLIERTRAAGHAALARSDLPVEERVLEMFVAIHGQMIGEPNAENMNELMQAAKELVGDAPEELEREQTAGLARLLRSAGVGLAWKDAELSPKLLAEQLMATSYGWKHRAATAAEYREGMRVAVRIVCGGR